MELPRAKLFERAFLAAALSLVFAHYLWTASSSGTPFQLGADQQDYYNLLSDGLLSGELGFRVRPSAELLRLPDPYDPVANAPFRRYHDVSLYRGRYYLCFGVTPALALFIPFRMLFGVDLPEGLAVASMLFGGVSLCVCSFLLLLRASGVRSRFGFALAGVVLFGFSNFAPFVLRRPAVYEVAVASGFLFTMGAVCALLLALTRERLQLPLLGCASLALGLAVGSRPHHLLLAPLLAAAWVFLVRRRGAPKLKAALALLVPLGLCGSALLLYNHARFGAFFEFGQSYVLSDLYQPRLRLFAPAHVPSHLFLFLLAPPTFDLNFPFVHLWPSVMPRLPPDGIVLDALAGLLPCVPFVALSALSLPLLWSRPNGGAPLPRATACALLASALLLLLFLSSCISASARYFLDFVPLLLLSGALVWVELDALYANARGARLALHAGVLALLAYGTVVGLALGLTGYYDLFRKRNPAGYAAIEDRFVPLQRLLLSRSAGYGDVRVQLRFPARPAAGSEALLAVGEGERADVLCIRYEDDGQAVLKFHHGADEPRRSRPFATSPGRTRLLEVRMGSLLPRVHARVLPSLIPGLDQEDPQRSLRVRLDGQDLLVDRLDFEAGGSLSVGRNASAPGQCPEPFSGEISAFRRALAGR
jgi:hypothetical protein